MRHYGKSHRSIARRTAQKQIPDRPPPAGHPRRFSLIAVYMVPTRVLEQIFLDFLFIDIV